VDAAAVAYNPAVVNGDIGEGDGGAGDIQYTHGRIAVDRDPQAFGPDEGQVFVDGQTADKGDGSGYPGKIQSIAVTGLRNGLPQRACAAVGSVGNGPAAGDIDRRIEAGTVGAAVIDRHGRNQ